MSRNGAFSVHLVDDILIAVQRPKIIPFLEFIYGDPVIAIAAGWPQFSAAPIRSIAKQPIAPSRLTLVKIWFNRVWSGEGWPRTMVAFVIAAAEILFACTLGVATAFEYNAKQVPGYVSEPNWGLLYVAGLPTAVFTVSRLLEWIPAAIDSLNEIALAAKRENFRTAWNDRHSWWKVGAPWAGVALAAVLAFGLGWPAITAPLHCHSATPYYDWQIVGACAHDASHLLYLGLNAIAYGLQAWLIYVGLTVLLCSLVFSWEVLNFAFKPQQRHLSSDPAGLSNGGLRKFVLKWNREDVTGRCGLATCDRAFFFYMVALILAFTFALLTDYQKEFSQTFDAGGWLLTGGAFLLLPALLYLLFPFWSDFPRESVDSSGRALPEPRPWPFGDKLVSLFLLTAAGALIAKLAVIVMAVRPK